MKKVLCIVLVFLLSLGCIPALAEDGDYITRGEFCLEAEKFCYEIGLNVNFWAMETPFTDIGEGYDGKTFAIKYLYCLNVVEGKSKTEFKPDDYITRQEAAVIISRLIDCLRYYEIADIKTDIMVDFAFNDHNEIAPWAKDAVYKVANLGIMENTRNGFNPKGKLTCSDAVKIFENLYNEKFKTEPTTFADKMNTQMPDDENYMFSPLSIKMALSLAANGANQETADEICNILDEYSVGEYNQKAKKLIDKYSEADVLTLNVANSVWVNKSMTDGEFTKAFKENAQQFYNADLGTVNKTNAVETVNNWVSDKTKGLINSILPEGYNDFFASVVNAVYFKGAWENEFNEHFTQKDIFTNGDGTASQTDFMNQTGYFNYYDDTTTKIVELPYKNTDVFVDEETGEISRNSHENLDVSMYIIMSEDNINVEEKLSVVTGGFDNFARTRVKLSIPKFKIEYSMSLKEQLSVMGMEKAFDFNFNGILENEPLKIDDVLHKTYIKVDEKGTEAAAVTSIMMAGATAKPSDIVEFKADKPFYFVIRDNSLGEILFMGRYAYAE